MSLLDLSPLFAGHDQGDVASLEANGEFYYCVVYLNRANQRIEAAVAVAQEGGGLSVVFQSILAEATSTEITDTLGHPLDCPRVLASGTTFVAHWLQATTSSEGSPAPNLFRATMNMTAFDESVSTGWTQRGSVGVYTQFALYDAQPVIGHDDFVVARSTASPDGGEITVERFDVSSGYTWLDQDWTTIVLVAHEHTVLAVYAHEDDNDVLITYQSVDDGGVQNDYELWTTHLDADDGGTGASAETFAAFASAAGADYVQVGHERVEANVVAIVAEARSQFALSAGDNFEFLHHLAFRRVNSSTAARTGNEHWIPNLSMCSRPFAYAGGGSTDSSSPVDLYVLVSYKTVSEINDWDESYQYVLNLDHARWQATASGTDLRPRPVLTINTAGIPDGRHSGFHPSAFVPGVEVHIGGSVKRVNHVSSVAGAPPFGPKIKTRTIARVAWARQVSVGVTLDGGSTSDDSEIRPENAGIRLLHFHLEEPQTVFRDPTDPEQPVDNFAGAYPRSAHQSFDVGRGLFISGGTPGSYDGRQVVEAGYPSNPNIFATGAANTSTGHLDDETEYGPYIAVWEWIDNAGQVHRSGPSRPVTVTTETGDDTVQLFVRAMGISLKDNDLQYELAQSIQLTVYRFSTASTDPEVAALPGGGQFYRLYGGSVVMRPTQGPSNSLDAAVLGLYFTVLDTIPDAELIFHQPAPPELQFQEDLSSGLVGPLAYPPPALATACVWQNRVWGSDALEPSVLHYSDEVSFDPGSASIRAPFFFGSGRFVIGQIGEITALQPLNNYLIVFTASSIHAIGVSDAGGGLLNVTHEPLHYGTGCVSPRSVVMGPPGIFFQSAKGYHLLNRNRELEFDIVGAQVADDIAAAGNIMSASICENEPKLKLVCNGRPVTTWTTTWTVAASPTPEGEWSITLTGFDGLGEIANLEADNDMDEEIIANALAADISVLIANGTLDGVIVSATPDGDELVVVWAPDVVPSYTDDAPGGNNITGVDTSELATYPRVLVFNYFTRTWSRADLVDTNTDERLCETVDGVMWRGLEGYQAHCVLTQGSLLVERGPNDPLAFVDQTRTSEVGIPIDIRTSWLTFNTIAGWCRVYKIDLQGEVTNYSGLAVDVESCVSGDYDDPELDTYTWASPAPAAGRIQPRIQLCSGVRVRIYEDLATMTENENLALTGLVFELGVHKGPRRLADSQKGT